jgi:DNA invertase Pin-like site-specific DNA recombinase
MKRKAISYIRFSDSRQKSGSSVERQESMIADWLRHHPDYDLCDLKFKDLGKSGFHGEHIEAGGGFGELLVAITEGAIRSGDVVLVEAMDRAGRLAPLDMLTLVIGPILKAGVSIVTLDDLQEYTEVSVGGTQVFLLLAKIQASHEYSKTLSRRVSASYAKRRTEAKAGVTPKRMTPAWLNSDGSVREDVAHWVKVAFELYVAGLGKATIAKRMRDSGVELLAKCSGATVEGWLRNKAVIGKWEVLVGTPDHEVIDGVYQPIIEPSLFYMAQIQADKVRTQRPVKTATNFLVGLVRCEPCGKNFIMQNKDGVPHSMRCRTRQNLKGCENFHTVPKPVMDKIYAYTSPRAAQEAIAQQELGVNEKEILGHEADLMAVSKKVENLAETISQVGPMPELITALRHAQTDRDAAERAVTLLRATVVVPATQGWRTQGEIWTLEKEDPQRLAAMLRTVGYSITVHADGRITSTHTDTTFRYAGVDRKADMYKLMNGDKLILIEKKSTEYPYWEAFDGDDVAESVWLEEDYADLQRQHE